jgi:hypothetical protein
MAKRIDWTVTEPDDPRFFERDSNNPNTNISASTFDPTDPTSKGNPVGEAYNKFLQTAEIGQTFDFGAVDPTQKGISNKFVGFNKMGTPIIQTIESPERTDWRGAIAGAGPSYAAQLKALTDTGRSEQEARFLIAQTSGPEFVTQNVGTGAPKKNPIGVLADGTPFYGWDAGGKPVTSISGVVYSTTSPSDAISKFNTGSSPVVTGSTTTTTTATTTTTTSTAGMTATQYNERLGIYSAMADRFNKYGLTGLANKIKELAIQGATEATITLQLQDTPEYQQRFAANADRIKKGLAALTPAEYVNVEDSYRQVLRAYGLKQFDNDAYVRQFIANDMSPTELSNRVVTAVQRVQNADPAITKQLKDYYGIGAPDMVAYVLDPQQQFQKIERQIAASEIGVAAGRQGLQAGVSVAEQLAAQGVSQAEAQKGYATIADILPTAEKLSDIYGTTLEEYGQAEGEQEVFNQLASAQRKRQRLTARELAAFSGASGVNKTSLSQQTAGQY